MYEYEYKVICDVIRQSTDNALSYFELPWISKISHPYSEFQIEFYDENGRYRPFDVHFDLPPNPDEEWYTQEIIRQLQKKLNGNKN